jgi:phosphoribosyl 1,2-cyclic phosphate phosphodiesterase
LLETSGCRYLLDAGQWHLASRFPAGTLDGIFLTHFHVDHLQGLFHLRWGIGPEIPVYCPPDPEGCTDLYRHPGILRFFPQTEFVPFCLGDLQVTPLPLNHSKPTLGYLFEADNASLAYLTDTKGLPAKTQALLTARSPHTLVLDCSFEPGSPKLGHNNLDEAVAIHDAIAPRQTVLTHIGHDLDVWLRHHADTLPNNLLVGVDGLALTPLL